MHFHPSQSFLITTDILDLEALPFTAGPSTFGAVVALGARRTLIVGEENGDGPSRLDAHRWLVVGGSGVEEHLNTTEVGPRHFY